MNQQLEISALGGLTIKQDGAIQTELTSQKAQAMLIYLICTGRPHSREALADLLWPDSPAAQALSNIRKLLTRLRPYLADYLLITRQTVAFDRSQPYWLDVAELERHLAWVAQSTSRNLNLTRPVIQQLEKAVALYQGDFLKGFSLRDSEGFEEWVLVEQERLRRMATKTLELLVVYYLETGDYAAGIEQAARLLKLDPLHEEAHRYMMTLLAYSGQRSAAMAHYKTYQRYLVNELDIAPEAETTDLYERIRKNEIGLKEAGGALTNGNLARPSSLALRPSDRISVLRRVDLFAETPDNLLSEIADLLEEVSYQAGQTIFEKGELGQCMYIIVEGRVQVHDGKRVLNELAERDIFGEMAVLDSAPRLATVTAQTNTRLWRLEQATLYRLMAGRLEIMRGIIQVLSRRLRQRVQEVVEMDTRLQAQAEQLAALSVGAKS